MRLTQTVPVTVVETPEFLSATRKMMSETEHEQVVDYLAHNPKAGDVIPGTGGVRKLRWGLEGRGKRGGARIVYFYHGAEMALFLLSAYAKNERTDLSHNDRREFKRLTAQLVENFYRKLP